MNTNREGSKRVRPLPGWPIAPWAILAFVGAASLLVGMVTFAATLGDTEEHANGRAPELTTKEGVSSTAGPITVTVSAAAYSSTSVFLEIGLSGSVPVGHVRIEGDSFSGSDLHPADSVAGINLNGQAATVARFRGVTEKGPYTLRISSIDLSDADGAPTRIQGPWVLVLKGPKDANALRQESLTGLLASEFGGIRVSPIRAVRSSLETLVTVSIEGPPGVGSLAFPELSVPSGEAVHGVRIDGSVDGGLTTFAFPPTQFGSPITLRFDSFIIPGQPGTSGYATVALSSVLPERTESIAPGQRFGINTTDILDDGQHGLRLSGVWFGTSGKRDDPLDLVSFTLLGGVEDARSFRLQLPDGLVLEPIGSGTDYGTTSTGASVGTPTSYVQFKFPSFVRLRGDVRLTMGNPSVVVNGPWAVSLNP